LNAGLIRRVWERAGDRCEYCQLPAAFHPAPFQIDHIIARQHGGKTELENLALACVHCNRFKGPNVAGPDPDTREIVRLFHPRRDSWADHFVWDGPELKARTQIGRVTIAVLVINDPEVVAVRRALQDEGVFWR
jgi:HNH endonuclease